MGLILGIIVCILAIPVAIVTAFGSSDFETGRQTASPWWVAINAGATVLLGAALIFTHYHPLHW